MRTLMPGNTVEGKLVMVTYTLNEHKIKFNAIFVAEIFGASNDIFRMLVTKFIQT